MLLFVHYLRRIVGVFVSNWNQQLLHRIFYTIPDILVSRYCLTSRGQNVDLRVKCSRHFDALIIAIVWWKIEKNRTVNDEYDFERSFYGVMLNWYVTWDQSVTVLGQAIFCALYIFVSNWNWQALHITFYAVPDILHSRHYLTSRGQTVDLSVKRSGHLYTLTNVTVWWKIEKNRTVNDEYEFKRSLISICINLTVIGGHILTNSGRLCHCA